MKKVIELEWGFMSNTQQFPVLKAGRIISLTAYEKGQGWYGGRFPIAFAVCTADTEITQERHRRGEGDIPGRIWWRDVKPVIFRDYSRAKAVAEKWAVNENERSEK